MVTKKNAARPKKSAKPVRKKGAHKTPQLSAKGAKQFTEDVKSSLKHRYPKKGVIIPEGHDYIVYVPGAPDIAIKNRLIYQGVLPSETDMKPLTSEEVFQKVINDIRRSTDQHKVICLILSEMQKDRERKVTANEKDLELVEANLKDANEALRAFDNIRNGGLEKLMFK